MFVRPLACAFLLLAGATAQSTTADGLLTIQTAAPSETVDGESTTSACVEVCVVESCTQCPLTNPLRTSETIPLLTNFCNGVYTDTPCSSVTGQVSIPQGETPEPTSTSASSTDVSSSEGASSTSAAQASSGSSSKSPSRTPTSSASGSAPSSSSSSSPTPGAAASVLKGDGGFVWVAALSGLSATLGFALALL